ncbi:hypothetical protein RND71_023089 [Anisodus tanguticus]|uniref:Late embryogenesis abundant protein LEA-2 subgroup domain-containing protein n=1 Tax=Anisodus tanguticus TaxID=243964 RepID=A0AAE1RRZ9_9SOLA|nr:hypothetical protein RND71_023089 [Anisodus tanguticus]
MSELRRTPPLYIQFTTNTSTSSPSHPSLRAIVVAYFFIFKPKSPKIVVEAVRFPTFFITNDTVNFTFFWYVSVTNPNCDEFTYYNNSLQLSYSGESVGLVFIPTGKIDVGKTHHMSTKIDVQCYPLLAKLKADVSAGVILTAATANDGCGGVGGPPTMEVETRMKSVYT